MLEARVQERLIMQAVDQAAEQGFRPRRDEPGGDVGAGGSSTSGARWQGNAHSARAIWFEGTVY